MSTTDVSDDMENAGSVPEQREGNPPVPETARVNSPGAGISDVAVVAGTTAGASNPGRKTHLISKNGYGLQLIGFFSRKALDKFAARKELPAQVYVIRETYRKRPWQAIIHSLHSSNAAAREERAGPTAGGPGGTRALDTLPAERDQATGYRDRAGVTNGSRSRGSA